MRHFFIFSGKLAISKKSTYLEEKKFLQTLFLKNSNQQNRL